MSKKLILLKEMPGSKIEIGDEVPYDSEGFAVDHGGWCIDYLVLEGFCKWVKEGKTLKSIYQDELYGIVRSEPCSGRNHFWTMKKSPKQLAEIAHEHEKKLFLSVFDKETSGIGGYDKESLLGRIRKALEYC